MGLSGLIWALLGLSGPYLGLNRPLLALFGTYQASLGLIWALLGPIWALLGLTGPYWALNACWTISTLAFIAFLGNSGVFFRQNGLKTHPMANDHHFCVHI